MPGPAAASTSFVAAPEDADGREKPGHDGFSVAGFTSPPWCRDRLAVPHQPVDMHADMRGLGRRIGERDGLVEGVAGLRAAAELDQQRALHAEEVEIGRQLGRQRLDHRERGLWASHLGDGDSPVEGNDRRRLHVPRAPHRAGRFAPSRCPRAARRGHAARRSPPVPGKGPGRRWRIALSISASPSAMQRPFHRLRSWSSRSMIAAGRHRAGPACARAAAGAAPSAP